MASLHITKVAFGCGDVETLAGRMAARAGESGGEAWLETRFRPKQADELIGGSVYWIVKHRLVARQEILGFAETEQGRCRIRLAPTLVAIHTRPKRAHQGWRYLTAEDCPADRDGGEDDGLSAMPPRLVNALAALALI